MSRRGRRLVAALAGFALVLLGLTLTSAPALARPNCDVPNPPPICEVREPVIKLPDLTASVAGPATAVGGAAASYVVRVANLAGSNAALARSVSVRIAATGGAVVTGAALTGWSCGVSGGVATCAGGTLAIGGSASIPVTVRLPAADASVRVSAAADPSNAIRERNEGNNTGSMATAITTPKLPDLRLTMTGPSSVRGGSDDGVWTMTVTNIGSAPAGEVDVWWLTNWDGADNTWGNPDKLSEVGSGAIGFSCAPSAQAWAELGPPQVYCYGNQALQPGASATIVVTAKPPAPDHVGRGTGVSSVTGTVDYGRLVTESNEGNNAATVVSTILW